MKMARKLGLLLCTAILIGTFGSSAKADALDKLTIFTFGAPVEVPGDVILPAGTYILNCSTVQRAATSFRSSIKAKQGSTQRYLRFRLNVLARLIRPSLNFMKHLLVLKTRSKPGSTLGTLMDRNSYTRRLAQLN